MSRREDRALTDDFLNKEKHPTPVRISRVWLTRRGTAVSVLYRVEGDTASFRTPRAQCEHLDFLTDDDIRARLRAWKAAFNKARAYPEALPQFFDAPFEKALRSYLRETAQPTVVKAYLSYLTRIILPWLHAHADIDNLAQLEPETKSERRHLRAAIPRLAEYIDSRLNAPSTRIQCRLALRRFAEFLTTRRGLVLDLALLPKVRRPSSSEPTEPVLPGVRLPSREEMHAFLADLSPSREAWVLTVMASFGVRFGEALAFRRENLLSAEAVKGGLLKAFVDEGRVFLAAHIREAQKRDPAHKRAPKKGEYYGACLHKPLAQLLVSRLKSETWKPFAVEIPGEYFRTHEAVCALLVDAPGPLSLYRPHDLRRWSVTWGIAENPRDFFIVSRIHGHKSDETTRLYLDFFKQFAAIPNSESEDLKLIGE